MSFLHKYNQIFQQINVQLIREIPYFSGQTAYDIAKQNCLIRQRYSGSLGNLNSLINLTKILSENNINYYIDEFIEDSPVGNIRFRNLVVDFNFTESSNYIILGAHHDSKFLPKMPFFEGANDGASGVGLILGLILFLHTNQIKYPVNLKFILFDGEECFYHYSNNDGLIGSKYAAKKYSKNCLAMILFDMIGSSDLNIQFPKNSNAQLLKYTQQIITNLDYQLYFDFSQKQYIIDDTNPFEKMNVPTLNFIDFKYKFWHTNQDTFDKLSQNSFEVIGNVCLELLRTLSLLHTSQI